MAYGGGFAPLPIRLGGTGEEEGWTAEQQSRLVADSIAHVRTAPYAVVTFLFNSSSFEVQNYVGANGEGVANAPDVSNDGTGEGTLTFPGIFTDDYEDEFRFNIKQARIYVSGVAGVPLQATYEITGAKTLHFYIRNMAGTLVGSTCTITAKVWCPRNPQIEDYGGDLNKEDSKTEGKTPYAYSLYRELYKMRGSAYKDKTTAPLVHAENLALARMLGWLYFREAERLEANALPGRSDERLDYWIKILDVPTKLGDTRGVMRRKCATKYKAGNDATRPGLTKAVEELLGSGLVELHFIDGTSTANPPDITYWPGVNPGPADLDLGGGTWMSFRSHIWAEVQKPEGTEVHEFQQKMNVDFYSLMAARTPAWCSFDWATSDGFLVDISSMDFDGMGE